MDQPTLTGSHGKCTQIHGKYTDGFFKKKFMEISWACIPMLCQCKLIKMLYIRVM